MGTWLGMDHLRIDETVDAPHEFHAWLTLVDRPPCPKCKSSSRSTYHAQGRETEIADLPVLGKPARLTIRRTRWKCSCSLAATFSSRGAGIHPKFKMTERLMRFVENAVTKRPVADVARDTGLSRSTVRNIAIALSHDLEKHHRFPTPRVFSIDGIKLNGRDNMVFSNAITGHPLGIIESIEATKCRAWIRDHIVARDVEIFVTDLHVTNQSIAKRPLGHAIHVADKFHLVRDFQVALSKIVNIRLDELRNDDRAADAEELWDAKPAIMTVDDKRRLSRERKGKDQLPLPLTRLTAILDKHEDVDRAFWGRYDLFRFYSSTTWAEAEPFFDRFLMRVEQLQHVKLVKEFLARITSHHLSIRNYFDSVELTAKGKLRGATTNAAEQRNSTIRKIWRSGHGISGVELLRLRTVYQPWQVHRDIVRCSHTDCTMWLGPLYGPWPRDDLPPAGMTGPRCLKHIA